MSFKIWVDPELIPDNVNFKYSCIETENRNAANFYFHTLQRKVPHHAISLYEPDKFQYHEYVGATGLIDRMLNDAYYITNACNLSHLKLEDERLYFVRPASGSKPFTGFCCYGKNVIEELYKLRQIEKFNGHELLIVAEYKLISPLEFRFWILDGKIVGEGCYSHTKASGIMCPGARAFAQQVIDGCDLSYFGDGVVIDVCCEQLAHEYKIVEANAFSTSGWYEGLNIEAMLRSICQFYNE